MTRWLRCRAHVDRLIAAVLFVLATPLLAVLILLVRTGDGEPGLIRLPRVGQYGRRFGMWKLRSMRPSPGAAGPPITRVHDERVTPLGRWLRRYHLDELPQLLNVVRGEMALVGPRPETPEYVRLGDRRWREVLTARPGIAGLSQALVAEWEAEALVDGRWDEVYREDILPVKLAIDGWYVRHASPWIDLLLLVSILQQFVARRGAPSLRRRLQGLVPETAAAPRVLATPLTTGGTSEP